MDTHACNFTVQTRRPLAYAVRERDQRTLASARAPAALPLRFGWGVVGLGIRDGRKDLRRMEC